MLRVKNLFELEENISMTKLRLEFLNRAEPNFPAYKEMINLKKEAMLKL